MNESGRTDWQQIVRARFAVLCLSPERESGIVEEVALHLEAVSDDARDAG